MTASPEFFVANGDVSLCVQTFGDSHAEPLLLIMGLAGPMTWWDPALCEQLADAGFYVIRYDNRDTGRSTKLTTPPRRRDLVTGFVARRGRAAYGLADMADDALAILDHLGLPRAHLMGVSMGGMIAQTLAIAHPERVMSLTSIMSTTGRRTVGFQSPTLYRALLTNTHPTREQYVAHARTWWRLIGSPAFPTPLEARQRKAEETYDRGFDPDGVMRQMVAIVNAPDRTAALSQLDVPTVVVHGIRDPMVHPSGGRATAAAIPGADLWLVPGLGHDLPPELFDLFVRAATTAAAGARTPR